MTAQAAARFTLIAGAGMALLADEQTFIDLPNSSLFFAEEHEVVPG